MPTPGRIWWHLILNTHGSWLHGDPRGFRSRDHRIHSSGDYKHRPPPDEHEGLRRYHQQRSAGAILIPEHLYATVGERIRAKAQEKQHRLIVLSAGITHAHGLVELPDDYALAKKVMGSWKQAASHAVRAELPGKVWAAGGVPVDVRSRSHFERVYPYIVEHAAKEGAWVWELDARAGLGQW